MENLIICVLAGIALLSIFAIAEGLYYGLAWLARKAGVLHDEH